MKIKILKIIIGLLVSGILLFGLYSFTAEYSRSPEIHKLFNMIFGFKIYTNKDLSITIGSVLLSLFLIGISFEVSKILSSKIVPSILKRFNVSEGAMSAVQNLSFYLFLVIFIILAFSASKIPLTVFTLFGGALAIGVGFGSQSLVSNFISGIIIQVERPMKVGDIIVLENSRGKVTEIGARSTKLLTAENTHVIVPNSHFLDRQFTNLTLTNYIVRSNVNLAFKPDQNPQIIKKMLLDCTLKLEGIMENPEPEIYFTDINENSIKFSVYFWIYLNKEKGRAEQESALRELVFEEVKNQNLEFSKPIILAKSE